MEFKSSDVSKIVRYCRLTVKIPSGYEASGNFDKINLNSYSYSFPPWNPATQTQAIKIRDGTKYEEVVGVRRYWKHLLRGYTNLTIYYDLTLMELGE